MIYSVWNQKRRQYDYFQTNTEQEKANTPKPKHFPNRKLGLTINEAAWPVPSGARYIGSGDDAVGRVGAFKRGMPLSGFNVDTGGFLILAVAGLIAWKVLK